MSLHRVTRCDLYMWALSSNGIFKADSIVHDMSNNISQDDEKISPQGDFTHVESHLPSSKQNAADDAFAQGQVETGYEGLSIIATIKHFKIAFVVCFAATFAAATDGYQSTLLCQEVDLH